MTAYLNVTAKLLSYGDTVTNSNPRLRYFDWARDLSGVTVDSPKSQAYQLAPGETLSVFSGIRSTSLDNTTQFTVSLSTINPSVYRFTHSGGTAPALRASRGLALNAETIVIAVLSNNTVTATLSGIPVHNFSGVLVGDIVFIPHTTTGDTASVFSVLNAGWWTVISSTATKLGLARAPGETFEATAETVLLTSSTQFVAYSAAGVQSGDSVDVSSGFSSQGTYEISTATPGWFEVLSSLPLAQESGIPGITGMIYFTDCKQFLYIEADQEAAVRVNGSIDSSQRISPIEAGNPDRPGSYWKLGPSWSLSLVNRSSNTMNALVLHCE